MLSVKQGGIKYHFWVFGMIRPVIEPRSPGPLAKHSTLLQPKYTKKNNHIKKNILNIF